MSKPPSRRHVGRSKCEVSVLGLGGASLGNLFEILPDGLFPLASAQGFSFPIAGPLKPAILATGATPVPEGSFA